MLFMEAEHDKALGMNANMDRPDKFSETFIFRHKVSIDRLFGTNSKQGLVDTLDQRARET